MRRVCILAVIAGVASSCWAERRSSTRIEAEYYVLEYAQHYRVPVALVRAVVERESRRLSRNVLVQNLSPRPPS